VCDDSQRNNLIGDKGINWLGKLPVHLTALQELDLGKNRLHDKSGKWLAVRYIVLPSVDRLV
jgi:hypothetical protein